MAVCRDCPWVSLHVCLLACMPISIFLYACQLIILFASMNAWNEGPTVWLSGCLDVLMFSNAYINIGLSVSGSLGICLSVRLSVCLCMAACQFVCQHFCLYVYIYIFAFLSVCLYIHCLHFSLSISSFNSLSFCLSACLRPSVVSIGCLFVCLHVCICLHACHSVCMSIRRSDCMSVCLPDFISICLTVCMYVCLCLSACLSVCLSACISVCLYVWLSVFLSVCLYIYVVLLVRTYFVNHLRSRDVGIFWRKLWLFSRSLVILTNGCRHIMSGWHHCAVAMSTFTPTVSGKKSAGCVESFMDLSSKFSGSIVQSMTFDGAISSGFDCCISVNGKAVGIRIADIWAIDPLVCQWRRKGRGQLIYKVTFVIKNKPFGNILVISCPCFAKS